MFKTLLRLVPSASLLLLGGCVYEQEGPPEAHFQQFAAKSPQGDTVTVCHAYGCKMQTPFTFSQTDIEDIAGVMDRVRRNDSPHEERRALAYAIGWMERRVAPTVGTASDRPSMPNFNWSGDTLLGHTTQSARRNGDAGFASKRVATTQRVLPAA